MEAATSTPALKAKDYKSLAAIHAGSGPAKRDIQNQADMKSRIPGYR